MAKDKDCGVIRQRVPSFARGAVETTKTVAVESLRRDRHNKNNKADGSSGRQDVTRSRSDQALLE